MKVFEELSGGVYPKGTAPKAGNHVTVTFRVMNDGTAHCELRSGAVHQVSMKTGELVGTDMIVAPTSYRRLVNFVKRAKNHA